MGRVGRDRWNSFVSPATLKTQQKTITASQQNFIPRSSNQNIWDLNSVELYSKGVAAPSIVFISWTSRIFLEHSSEEGKTS